MSNYYAHECRLLRYFFTECCQAVYGVTYTVITQFDFKSSIVTIFKLYDCINLIP